MIKMKKRLEQVVKKMGNLEHRLEVATQEYHQHRDVAHEANVAKKQLRHQADKVRITHPTRAAKIDKEAAAAKERATRHHNKAIFKRGKVKEYQQRIHNLGVNQEKIIANIHKYQKEHGVTVHGNQVTGGTPRQRLKVALETAAHNCATGHQHNFYDMEGGWDIEHVLTHMSSDKRFDCSSFATGIHKACGLPDPNGTNYTGGYTGTLMSHCELISRAEVQVGDFVIYGSYPGHHVEVVLDPTHEITIGHGSAPIDRGVFNLFGDGNYGFYRNPALKNH
jgi:hypothetical protein